MILERRAISRFRRSCVGAPALLFWMLTTMHGHAAEKPALVPDRPTPLTTQSRISATIEFGLPALAAAITSDIPKRLTTFNERIACVHKRVLIFKVRANCDISGFVERSGPVILYGKGDRVIGAMPVYGAVAGQGANRITSHIDGATEARVTIEAQARPELRRDWSLDLHLSDGFHWTKPPYLHVLGHDIALAHFVEPKIRAQLARLRTRALAAARALDLRAKAASAWKHAFAPIKLADDPQVWLQLKPQSAAFAGVRTTKKILEGTLELSGSAETFVGHAPPIAMPTPLAPLGTAVAAPGKFEIILPVHIGYDVLREKIMEAIALMPKGRTVIRDVEIYPSSGKITLGLRVAKASETDPKAGTWIYFSATPEVDANRQTLKLPDLSADANQLGALVGDDKILAQLRQLNISYQAAYTKLLDTANQRLTRPLKDGFRMQGHLASARLDEILLLPQGVSVVLRASGDLNILYGL